MTKTWKNLADEVFKWFPIDSGDIGNSKHERVLEIISVFPHADYLEISDYFDELSNYYYQKRKNLYDELARETIVRDIML